MNLEKTLYTICVAFLVIFVIEFVNVMQGSRGVYEKCIVLHVCLCESNKSSSINLKLLFVF